MTINTEQQAFEQFEAEHVRVPDFENKQARRVQQEFRAALKEWLGARHADSFLAGSYRRKTQAVHLKDLDIIIVLNDPTGELRASPSGTLALMKQAAFCYPAVAIATTKCRAVECELEGYTFWADLVPALDDGQGGYLLAYVDRQEDIDEWRPADPKGQTQACHDKNDVTDGAYVPVTRICKFWNASFVSTPDQTKPLRSYLVEAILFDALTEPVSWPEAVLAFFEAAERHLSNPRPSVPCPGDPDAFVDERLDDERRIAALSKVQAVLVHARAAVAKMDLGDALDEWAKVLGPSFPAPSTRPAALAAALRRQTATVVGSGASVSSSGRRTPVVRSHGPAPLA
jgi:Second Messenger Oligonucleotide or Dinucleotide Synthetase domain